MKWHRFRRISRYFLAILLLLWLGMGVYHTVKPLPAGISVASPERAAFNVRFLADHTWTDDHGVRHTDQQIFDRVLELIGQAGQLVVLDMFLFNDFAGDPTAGHDPNMRPLSDELADALMARKARVPTMRVVLITDPINHLYGGLRSARLMQLQQAGVEVVMTDLSRLRDSNPLWSGWWRLCCQWLGNSGSGGWLPNPVGHDKVTLRTWLSILNFKANHRKTLLVDSPKGLVGLVTSGNPHDASSAHGNVALEFMGPAVLDLLQSEQAVLDFSALRTAPIKWAVQKPNPNPSDATLQVLTEAAIRDRVLDTLAHSQSGDQVDLAMFYLSHRAIIDALTAAHRRGVELRVLLDPNEDAFGKKKNGIPNRQVAAELNEAGISVRWCDTHGEQCHSKMLLSRWQSGRSQLLLGSANFTRRNLDDLNLETNVVLQGSVDEPAIRQALAYFELYWHNGPGQHFSQPYARYADEGRWRYWRYRLMEATGLSTF